MKPSDYLKKEYSKGYEDHGHTSIEVHCILGSSDVDEDKLDKRFIDKEELRDKIMDIRQETILRVDNHNELIVREEVIDEILKLLEE